MYGVESGGGGGGEEEEDEGGDSTQVPKFRHRHSLRQKLSQLGNGPMMLDRGQVCIVQKCYKNDYGYEKGIKYGMQEHTRTKTRTTTIPSPLPTTYASKASLSFSTLSLPLTFRCPSISIEVSSWFRIDLESFM